MSFSLLDPGQIIKYVYDEATQAIKISGSITTIEGATAAEGAVSPAELKVVAGTDSGGLVRAISTDSNGDLQVDILSSALPTGAATSANQTTTNTSLSSLDGKLGTLGQKNMAGSAPVVLASDQAAIPVTTVYLDVIDLLDTPVMDTSSVAITASSGTPVQVVASLAANAKKLKINDTTGEFIGVYTGAALSEVLQCVIGPGEDGTIELQISSTERVSVRNMANSAISVGNLCIQFIG